MTTQAEIAGRLVQAREAKGYSGAQLARELGMSQQKYNPYEHEREMKASMLIQVCAILECSPSWLLGIKEEGQQLPPESALLKELKAEFERLNPKGQQKVLEYAEDLSETYGDREAREETEELDAEGAERRTA